MRTWLVEARKMKGLSQKEVAKAAKISQPTYWEYENGISTPTPTIAKRIGAVLGFPWTRFYDDDEMHEQSNSPGEIACVPPHQEFPGEPLVTQGNPQQFQAAQLSDTARLLIGGDSAAVENESQKRVPQQKL